eukprot:15298472-Alexandrium_andersonii.AAC.1
MWKRHCQGGVASAHVPPGPPAAALHRAVAAEAPSAGRHWGPALGRSSVSCHKEHHAARRWAWTSSTRMRHGCGAWSTRNSREQLRESSVPPSAACHPAPMGAARPRCSPAASGHWQCWA